MCVCMLRVHSRIYPSGVTLSMRYLKGSLLSYLNKMEEEVGGKGAVKEILNM